MKLKKKLCYIILVLVMYFLISSYFKSLNLNSNEDFISNLLQVSNYHFNYEKTNKSLISFIDKPITIIDKVFAYNQTEQVFNYNELYKSVYIYSTHPNEAYKDNSLDIITASKLLQNELNERGIYTIVEEKNVNDYINKYDNNYEVTRVFLEEQLKENDFDLIIDLHRDYTSNNTSVIINGKNYAKVMFVMNVNYENKLLASRINQIIESNYKGISRGIYNKYVDNFNQDLNEKVILIELGSDKNTKEEVINTIEVLADSIKELLE